MKARLQFGPIRLVGIVLLMTGWVVYNGASGAVEMFLNIPGIPGEADDPVHADEIDVLSWSWGMSNSATTHDGGSAGVASFDDLVFTKYVDKASPMLMLACANENHLSATLVVRSVGPSPLEYLTITIPDLLVVSVRQVITTADDRPMETVTLNFAEIEYSYVPKGPGGEPEPPVDFVWNLNTPPG